MLLEVNHLDFDYPSNDFSYQLKPLLQDVCFSLSSGSLLHLRGSNGSGKTTLLRLLAGLLQPVSGEICSNGLNIEKQRISYQEQLCYVGHKTGISPALTVIENCRFDLQYSVPDRDDKTCDELLRRFALFEFQDTVCALLSAGQRRRVGLFRLLLSQATVWLLDEPLVALDHDMIDVLMNCLNEHLHSGGLIILTSHQRLPLNIETYQEYCL